MTIRKICHRKMVFHATTKENPHSNDDRVNTNASSGAFVPWIWCVSPFWSCHFPCNAKANSKAPFFVLLLVQAFLKKRRAPAIMQFQLSEIMWGRARVRLRAKEEERTTASTDRMQSWIKSKNPRKLGQSCATEFYMWSVRTEIFQWNSTVFFLSSCFVRFWSRARAHVHPPFHSNYISCIWRWDLCRKCIIYWHRRRRRRRRRRQARQWISLAKLSMAHKAFDRSSVTE